MFEIAGKEVWKGLWVGRDGSFSLFIKTILTFKKHEEKLKRNDRLKKIVLNKKQSFSKWCFLVFNTVVFENNPTVVNDARVNDH